MIFFRQVNVWSQNKNRYTNFQIISSEIDNRTFPLFHLLICQWRLVNSQETSYFVRRWREITLSNWQQTNLKSISCICYIDGCASMYINLIASKSSCYWSYWSATACNWVLCWRYITYVILVCTIKRPLLIWVYKLFRRGWKCYGITVKC